MTEKQLEKKLVDAVKHKGGIAYKFVSPGQAGVPDRLVLLPGGKIGFVEVKKPKKGKLRKIQKLQIRRIQALGFKCYILDDPDKIFWLVNDIKYGISLEEEDRLTTDLLEMIKEDY